MGKIRSRKCHKCKHTLKSKNFVTLKNGKPVCDKHKNGISEEIFFKGKTCKDFELAHKYNIADMVGNVFKKINKHSNGEIKDKPKTKHSKTSTVVSINKNIN